MDWYLTLRMWPHPLTTYPLALCWFIDILCHCAVWPSAPWSILVPSAAAAGFVRCRHLIIFRLCNIFLEFAEFSFDIK